MRRDRFEGHAPEVRLESVVGREGQHGAAHRRGIRGKAGADPDLDGHDPSRLHTGDVDDVVAVEDGGRRRLPELGGQGLEVRLRDIGQAEGREERVAEREHARGQREEWSVAPDEAERLEREQEAPCAGPGLAGAPGDVAQGEVTVLGVEGADDVERLRDGLDHVGADAWL